MRRHTFFGTAVLAAVLAAAPLASAQNRQRWPSRGDNGGDNGGQRGGQQRSSGGGEQRGSGGGQQRVERQAQPRDGGRVDSPRDSGRRDSGDTARRQPVPQEPQAAPQPQREPQTFVQRNDGNRRDDGRRADGRSDNRPGTAGTDRYAVPRNGPVPRYRDGDHRVYVQPRSNYYVYRYPSYRYAPGYYGYRAVRPGYYGYRYYDPYFVGDFYWSNYAWQPRSYYSGSSWDYGLGKLRLDIDQRDAEVYIDGYYAGVVDEFDGVLQGLRLEPGHYSVEVGLPGFAPLRFEVQITPGRTTTYRGSLYAEP